MGTQQQKLAIFRLLFDLSSRTKKTNDLSDSEWEYLGIAARTLDISNEEAELCINEMNNIFANIDIIDKLFQISENDFTKGRCKATVGDMIVIYSYIELFRNCLYYKKEPTQEEKYFCNVIFYRIGLNSRFRNLECDRLGDSFYPNAIKQYEGAQWHELESEFLYRSEFIENIENTMSVISKILPERHRFRNFI